MTRVRAAAHLSIRYLRFARRDRGYNLLGAVLIVALSLIPLIVVLEVANGMIDGITRRFIEVGTYHLQFHMYGDMTGQEESEVLGAMMEVDGINLAVPERQGLGLVYTPEARTGVQIRSVIPDLYDRDSLFRKYITLISGTFDLTRSDNVLLGKVVAETIGAEVGSQIKLLTGKRLGDDRILPKVTRFTVTGIFSSGYQDMDKTWIYIPLETGRRIIPGDNAYQFIGIKTADPYEDLGSVIKSLRNSLPDGLGMYRINTWFELEENQYRSFQTTKYLLLFIMFLIVLVASVNVSTTLVMMVLEKTQDIAILKSMGAHPSVVSYSFLMSGFFIGAAGTAIGIVMGMLIAVNINELIRILEVLSNGVRFLVNQLIAPSSPFSLSQSVSLMDPAFYLEEIPIRIAFLELFLIAFLTILLSTVAAFFPSRRAGALKPLEIIRRI